ncbi:hypothetical protein [Streptomyces xiaopingdaonensis]|uniref:hypothetical protein n=1 Tax=Streptomyces xiaopingdaonensis TaxID=1565415 RepID=UPI0002F8B5BF|nr:hypothetical protein [Streptomyces xiaopingdaonensis]
MEAVAASVIAVVGTLLGAGTTHFFQLRAARRAERFARVERLRDERIDAYSAFAGALADYRRGRMDHWFARNDDRGATPAEIHEMRREAQRLRATAMEAMFRAELLTDSPHLAETGRRALKAVDALGSVAAAPTSRNCARSRARPSTSTWRRRGCMCRGWGRRGEASADGRAGSSERVALSPVRSQSWGSDDTCRCGSPLRPAASLHNLYASTGIVAFPHRRLPLALVRS